MDGKKLAAAIIIIAGIGIGLSSLSRPKLIPATGSTTDFSAERAMKHVVTMSRYPHPPGSDEIERVRSYIFRQLADMDLSPQIHETTVAVPRGSGVVASTNKNIIARIPGTGSSKTILLDAHYDTRANTPGASDNSSSVAAVLEGTRALLAGTPLKNDVILLFTDNEEYGPLLGATSFVETYSRLYEIGMVLNMEGLGSTGPSILYETGPNSREAVKEWGRSVSRPVGQSWFQEIYKRTPINTDFTVFSDQGIPGMNFGFWAGGTVYHSMMDNPETFDPRSMQHQGSYVLAMTRYFGNQDLNAKRKTGDAVYFSLIPGRLISYSTRFAPILSGLAGLLLFGSAVIGFRSKQLSVRGSLKGLGGILISVLASSVLATGIWMGATRVHGEYQAMLTFRGMVYNAPFYLFAFAALALGIASVILVRFRRKTRVLDLYFGASLFWWILSILSSIFMPGFSYLFTWPLLFSALGILWVIRQSKLEEDSLLKEVVLSLGALSGLILFAPGIYVMFHFALAPMIGILIFLISLLLGLMVPQLDLFTRNKPWLLSYISLGVCAAFLLTGSLTAKFDDEHPRPNAVAYMLNADSGKATWFSGGTQQDSWTGQFFTSEPKRGAVGDLFPISRSSGFPIMRGEAPLIKLNPPMLEIMDDRTTSNLRVLRLKLSSPRAAPVIMLDVEPHEAVRAVILDEKRINAVDSNRDLWNLTYYAVPEEGFEIILELEASQVINIQLSDQTWELVPDVLDHPGVDIQPRTADMMPMPNFDYGTVVVRTIDFD